MSGTAAASKSIGVALFTVLVSSALPCAAATIRQFIPQGRIDQQTSATAAFNADMVKLGDASAPAPFNVDCGALKGEGRWVDARTWTWRLPRPLQPGERCQFTLRAGQAALNGDPVTGNTRFEFFAAGPWPRSVRPAPGTPVDEEQAFIINAGGPIKPESVESNVWCEADGVGSRIPVRLLPPPQRAELLDAVRASTQDALVLACAERLPPGAKMKLVWGKGVAAASGAVSEKEESFVYTVRENFRATLSCEREKASAPCSPLSDIRLELSAFADAGQLKQVRLVTPEGARAPAELDTKAAKRGASADALRTLTFPGPFPQQAELTLEVPAGLKDDAGRALSNAASFPLKFRTGALPPLAKFPGSFGIVELKEGGLLPVTVRNLEPRVTGKFVTLPGQHRLMDQRLTEDADVIAAMQALTKFENQTRDVKVVVKGKTQTRTDSFYARELSFLDKKSGVASIDLPKPGGPAEFEVLGVPLAKPGYHVVEIESRMLGASLLAHPAPMYVRAAALVTNMAVHLKRGRDNALVWVTALDSGKPVAHVDVRISGCDGQEQARGSTDSEGRLLVAKAVEPGRCAGQDGFVFASARSGEDYSFVRSDWNEGIEPWRFGVETWGDQADLKIHAIMDRTLLRPGQTLSIKHLARLRGSAGFGIPPAERLPTRLTIRHGEEGTEYSQALTWDAQGSAVSQWKIPDGARRGTYELVLSGGKGGAVTSGEFRVSDFRLPVFTGSVQGVPPKQVAPSKVPLTLGLSFLNGGAAKNADVAVSATLRPRWPSYRGYETFDFNVGFDEQARAEFKVDDGREREHLVLQDRQMKLDGAGAGKLDVDLTEGVKGPSQLYAEMRFTDPNGEIQTINGTVELWPASVVLGIAVSDWAASRSGNRIQLVVLDTAGKPVPGRQVRVIAKRRVDYSHRRRIVGGFYAYENHSEFVDLGEVCSGQSDSRGMVLCETKTTDPGSIYLLAETRDDRNNVARAGTSYWNTGAQDLWFTAGNQDRIDVIPERRSYKPGETARLQVRTPFREATALVSVEAGGIIDTYVRPLSRFDPVIDLPVKAEWGPNVFVSVLAVRGRVQPLRWYSFFHWGWREPAAWFREWWTPPAPTAMVDLAKPAYRIGLAEFEVGTEGFKLNVDVKADKAEYRPREQATVRIKVTTPEGRAAPAGTEVAFAAVDQALLELLPNDSWDVLQAMLQKRAYQVETATAQMQVIGKRHFGKKALPPGGGGGRAPARELFDTLLLWNPRVVLDAAGMATLRVPLNDSLTEFRLVGVATSGAALFGTGSSTVRSKQELQLVSGLPPVVREKDRFTGLLTLRNGTAKAMSVTVAAKAGNMNETREVKLEPESATELAFNAIAPEIASGGSSTLVWDFNAKDANSSAIDALRITQQVLPAVPVTVQQASFQRISGGKYETAVTPPADALPGRGGIEVGLAPKLSTPPPGLRRFFEEYPFSCMEQMASVAVGLNDARRWQDAMAKLPAYLDSDGLANYFPGLGAGSAALTAYLLDLSSASGFAVPDDAKQRMLAALTAFAEGRVKPRYWSPLDDLTVRKLMVLEALTRQGRNVTRIAAALDVDVARLPTAGLIDWYLVVRRSPDLPQRAAVQTAAERELRNRLSYTGGRLTFTTERSDYWWWMMVSGDSNAFRLIDAVLDDADWQEDLPKLVRGALGRQARGNWRTTTANAWATVALAAFGRKFEKGAVTGVTGANLGRAKAQLDWKAQPEGSGPTPLMLPWPVPDKDARLSITHQGTGEPWATLQVLAALPAGKPRAFGYKVTRSVTPIQQKVPGQVSRGDLWRVTLNVEAQQDMTWVVVSDPIPAGARILGEGDGRDSRIATIDEDRRNRRLWPSFVERTFSTFNAYYEMVPRGNFQIEYTVRINNAGEFSLPPTRVEAMYAPDVFGETPNDKVTVQP
jgi:uncharacterized protein YfaS (alpha-2-macroglobulin family)